MLLMEYDCHIFSKYQVFQIKNLVFQSKYLVFRSKYVVFRVKTLDFDGNTRYFEAESFLHFEFEILGISIEVPSISKTSNFD